MNIIINLISIKSGGGQQVALNFINQVLKNDQFSPYFLVTENTIVHKALENYKYKNFFKVKKKLIKRIWFQFVIFKRIVKRTDAKIIYTMFGPGLHCKNVISITGCAYSNLFYPEIKFWSKYPILERIKLKLIDYYRLKSTLKSNYIIFENEAMQRRVSILFKYPKERTKLILPSISSYKDLEYSEEFNSRLGKIDKSKFNVLILSGWHKNKNIEIIPKVLFYARLAGVNDINFVITVSKNHPESIKLNKQSKKLGVDKQIVFFNSVNPSLIPNLYKTIDAIGLFSLLESFSNNIIESWYFNKPLFISNEEWSRAICKQSVIYVNRDDPKDICHKILNYRSTIETQKKIFKNSKNILKTYPNPTEKVDLQINFLKKIYEQEF